VRNEKDPFTLMRMIQVNIFNTISTLRTSMEGGVKKYFCVSTDKAANPVNMMGASKRIMELFLMRESRHQKISMARFANVAFSDGSLLHGFNQRFSKHQPISAPCDIRRYFLTQEESGELCLLSAMLGDNCDIFIPKHSEKLNLITFSEIAEKYLHMRGYEPFQCDSEDQARGRAKELIEQRKWPCYFFKTDTTGEKEFEEFYTNNESVDITRFASIGIIRNAVKYDESKLSAFEMAVARLREEGKWDKSQLLRLFIDILPDFDHVEIGKNLDQKM
jgi:FlaA1/EpsC-like NDP-sugar epimerase